MTACCPHPDAEHDGMGNCRHLDARTATGFANCYCNGGSS